MALSTSLHIFAINPFLPPSFDSLPIFSLTLTPTLTCRDQGDRQKEREQQKQSRPSTTVQGCALYRFMSRLLCLRLCTYTVIYVLTPRVLPWFFSCSLSETDRDRCTHLPLCVSLVVRIQRQRQADMVLYCIDSQCPSLSLLSLRARERLNCTSTSPRYDDTTPKTGRYTPIPYLRL